MKQLFVILALVASLFAAKAQTDTNQASFKRTVMGFVDSVTTASNWNAHVEAIYNDAIHKIGVKEGFDYLIVPNVYSTISVMEFNGSAFGLSGTFALQKHWDLFKGGLGVTTAAKSGVITCLSGQTFGSITVPGKSVSSGQFGGVVGGDIVFDFPKCKYAPDVILGYEKVSILSGNFFSIGLHCSLKNIF